MKKSGLVVFVFLQFLATLAIADHKDEIGALTARIQQLESGETGLNDSERFNELLDATYEYTMLSHPETATRLGDPRGQDRWTDNSEVARRQRDEDDQNLLAALESIDREALPESERVDFDLFHDYQKRIVEGQQFPMEFMPLNQMGGVQQDIARMMAIIQPERVEDYANMISRLEKTPVLVDQTIFWMRKGMAAGITPPAITLRDVPQQVRNQLVEDVSQSSLLVAFKQFPPAVDLPQQESLRKQAFHRENQPFFDDYEQLEYRKPVGLYDRPALQKYMGHCRAKAADVIASATADSLRAHSGFERRDFSRAELHVLNIRHIQHHSAQLILRLRTQADVDIPWFGSGWREV